MTDFLLSSLYIVTFRLVAYCSSLSHLCVVWGEAGTLWGGRGTDGHISISQPGGPASEAKTRVAYIFIFWRCIITLPIVKHLLARTGLCVSVSVKAVWNAETHLCVCNFEFLPQRALPPFSLALSLPLALFVWDYYACRSSPLIALKENYTQFYLFPAQWLCFNSSVVPL